MLVFDLEQEQQFSLQKHVEKVLGRVGEGDVTVACWEPGQISPNHLHPNATEIYFCFQGGGTMRTPGGTVEVKPGSFVVHPRGELLFGLERPGAWRGPGQLRRRRGRPGGGRGPFVCAGCRGRGRRQRHH